MLCFPGKPLKHLLPDALAVLDDLEPSRPPQPSERAGPLPRDLVTQSEDVLVDTRGYIYVTDKQWGLWILRYTGPDQPAPTDK